MSRNGVVQWGWREMEELLQCPVCLDIPAPGVVEQCRHGHHICASCKRNVETCPLCKCDFHGTRNFILEELIRHFDILKNTMLLNNIVNDTKVKKCKTKAPKIRDDPATVILKCDTPRRAVNTPECTRGMYPCRAADCDVELPMARLLNHVRSSHSDILTESVVNFTDVFTETFEIPYKNKKAINKNSFVLFVSGIGLVYLNIEIMRSGQLIVFLQMASKFTICQQYLGSVELFAEATNYSYNVRLVSTRLGFAGMMQSQHCFTLTKNQLKKISENKKFNCKLTLTRFNMLNYNVLTRPIRDQIMVTAGIRASLISEPSDEKPIKQIVVKNKKPVSKVTPSSSQANVQNPDINEIVARVIESLNLQEVISTVTASASNNTIPPTENDIRGARNVKKKKKNRRPNGV